MKIDWKIKSLVERYTMTIDDKVILYHYKKEDKFDLIMPYKDGYILQDIFGIITFKKTIPPLPDVIYHKDKTFLNHRKFLVGVDMRNYNLRYYNKYIEMDTLLEWLERNNLKNIIRDIKINNILNEPKTN